jgi:signal transduction histidine kinase
MDRNEALQLITDGNPRQRLQAARFLAANAEEQDHAALQAARRREADVWISAALDRAIRRSQSGVTGREASRSVHADFDEEAAYAEVYAQAVEETTQRLVHELRRFVGTARFYAEEEIPDYDRSKTKTELNQLASLMDAVEKLGRAAAAPAIEEFDLGQLISSIADTARNSRIGIELAGPQPLLCLGDRELVALVVRNGLINAIEASAALEGSTLPPVVVNWNETDDDYWIVALDRGIGLPVKTRNLFEVAVTNKDGGHLGMGLALAERAALSMNGSLNLSERSGGGAHFEFRWPKPA